MVSTDDAYVKADMATIAAKVGGYVQSVGIVENQAVKKGDLLAQIDPVDYRLAVEAAKGRIETQGATIARLAAQADVQRAAIDQTRAIARRRRGRPRPRRRRIRPRQRARWSTISAPPSASIRRARTATAPSRR